MAVRTIIIAGACALAAGPASAQIKLDPKAAKIPPQITERIQGADLRRDVTGPGGEGATSWVSPLLRNHPGTIGGERYSIDGERYLFEFGFTIINADKDNSVRGGVDCYSAEGAADTKYATRFEIAPMNAKSWRSDRAVPTPTTNGRMDEDQVWCNIWADQPVYAFGERFTEIGSNRNSAGFNLIAAAR